MNMGYRKALLPLAAGLALTSTAMAHPGHTGHGGFGGGFSHPFLGLDHLLVMLALGLWGFQQGGRAVWAIPGAFLVTMLGGFALGLSPVVLPVVEPVILASVVLCGVAIAMAVRLPLAAAATIAALFGIFHGFAHGMEMPFGADAATYAVGFLFATALLLGAGSLLGLVSQAATRKPAIRIAGAAIAVMGLVQIFF